MMNITESNDSDVEIQQQNQDASSDQSAKYINSEITEPSASATEAEKMVPQSQVDSIVGRAKRAAAEKARQETLLAVQHQIQQKEELFAKKNHNSGGESNKDLLSQEQLKQVYEIFEAKKNDEAGQRVYESFNTKLDAAKNKYPDIEEMAEDLGVYKIPELLFLINSLDNPADVIKELDAKPSKAAEVYVHLGVNPRKASKIIQEISSSIKNNAEGSTRKQPAKPSTDNIKPSLAGRDNGQMTLLDFKLDPRFRA